MRAFKKFNIDVGQNFSERRLCSRVWKNGKMTEVNVAQEVLAAGQKRARDFAALLGIEHPVLNAPMLEQTNLLLFIWKCLLIL